MDTGNDTIKGFPEHNWDPAHCISVPGTVFGIGFRCTCAHGAFQKQIEGNPEKTSEEVTDEVGSGSFTTLLRIVGVSPKVVRKVVEVMYGCSFCCRMQTGGLHPEMISTALRRLCTRP